MPKNRPRPIIVYVTTPRISEARRIAKALLKKNLIACANILPSPSLYRWKGQIVSAKESILLMKTTAEKFREIEKNVEKMHTYECPCVLQISIDRGNAAYLTWIRETVH